MEAKYQCLNVEWKVMDIRDMHEFENQMFDIAIDKATMDSMFYGSSWDPPIEVRENVKKYVNEVDRVLKPGGMFLWLSFRQPHFVKPLILRESWNTEVRTLPDRSGGVFQYFAYVMTKHSVDLASTASSPRERNNDL